MALVASSRKSLQIISLLFFHRQYAFQKRPVRIFGWPRLLVTTLMGKTLLEMKLLNLFL
jgi:hypothetical protein